MVVKKKSKKKDTQQPKNTQKKRKSPPEEQDDQDFLNKPRSSPRKKQSPKKSEAQSPKKQSKTKKEPVKEESEPMISKDSSLPWSSPALKTYGTPSKRSSVSPFLGGLAPMADLSDEELNEIEIEAPTEITSTPIKKQLPKEEQPENGNNKEKKKKSKAQLEEIVPKEKKPEKKEPPLEELSAFERDTKDFYDELDKVDLNSFAPIRRKVSNTSTDKL